MQSDATRLDYGSALLSKWTGPGAPGQPPDVVPLLGHTGSRRSWDPLDGRITELGMHLTIDTAARHVVIGIAAAPA